MLSLEDLTKPLTTDEVRATIYSILEQIGVNTTNWKPGAIVRTLIAMIAVVFSAFTYWSAAAVRGGFLLLARGDWLTATAKYDYSTERNPATFASGAVRLRNTGAGVYDFEAGDLTLKYTKTVNGQSITYNYTNTDTATVSLASGSVETPSYATIYIQAETIGQDPNIPSGATLVLQPDFDGVSVVVSTAIIGSEEETDQQLIHRSIAQASAISPNGPQEAYDYVCLTTKDGYGEVIAQKVSVVPGSVVRVYVANYSGSISNDGYEILNAAIQTNVVPLGVTAIVSRATNQSFAISYTAYYAKTTLSEATMQAYIAAALEDYFTTIPIGGFPGIGDSGHAIGTHWIYHDALKSVIEGACANVSGTTNPIFHAVVTVAGYGSADVEINANTNAQLGLISPDCVQS